MQPIVRYLRTTNKSLAGKALIEKFVDLIVRATMTI